MSGNKFLKPYTFTVYQSGKKIYALNQKEKDVVSQFLFFPFHLMITNSLQYLDYPEFIEKLDFSLINRDLHHKIICKGNINSQGNLQGDFVCEMYPIENYHNTADLPEISDEMIVMYNKLLSSRQYNVLIDEMKIDGVAKENMFTFISHIIDPDVKNKSDEIMYRLAQYSTHETEQSEYCTITFSIYNELLDGEVRISETKYDDDVLLKHRILFIGGIARDVVVKYIEQANTDLISIKNRTSIELYIRVKNTNNHYKGNDLISKCRIDIKNYDNDKLKLEKYITYYV